ncbi:MAG: hypothetical protein R3F46_06975 [bacterium]
MSRLINTLVLCSLSLLLLAAGCNKGGKEKIDTSNVEQTAPSLSAVPEAEQRDTSLEEEAAARLEQQRAEVRTELIAMLPEFEYSYDSAGDLITGAGLPPAGVEVPPLLDKLEERIKKLNKAPGQLEYQQMVRVMLTQFKSAGVSAQEPAGDSSGTQVENASGSTKDDADSLGLHKAPKVYGEWRSVREESDKYTMYHDENYYKQLLVFYNRNSQYSTFARGQQIKNDIFDYRYDRNSGELLLTAEDGRFTMKFYCYVRDSEPGLLYVRTEKGGAYTVYEKLGRGEEPLSEEEKQAFYDLQKDISGSTGGNARNEGN